MPKRYLAGAGVILGILASSSMAAIKCPEMPGAVTDINRDVKSDIAATIGSLGKVRAGDVSIKTEVVTKNLFDKYPNVDKLLALQIMSSTYCTMLNSASITDLEKLQRWEAFQNKVLNFNPSAPETTKSPTTKAGKSRVTDVLVEKVDGQSAIIDFRVLNEGSVDLQISRIILVPLKRERNCLQGSADYTKVYDFYNIGELYPVYERAQEIQVSQVISAGKSDRFGLKVGDSQPGCFGHYWKFKAYLITSMGKIGGQEVEIDLRRR